MADEMGMPNSVRFLNQFDGTSWHSGRSQASRSLITIDLNSQMSDYYQTMGVFGMMLEDPDASTYFEKAESLQDNVQKWLWDPNTQFFYDYDLDQQVIQPVKTAAAFYALFGGIAKKSQASSLIDHLTNPNEFWTKLPIPSVAIDDPFYSQELWQGPVSIDQEFWLIIGLQRYNLNTTVVQLSEKILRYLNNSFNLY